ncbi:MAG: universal stress protein [Solirubrobacteraceae bacterium]
MPILICYDGSPSAKRAVSVARATIADDHAVLLHVWEPPVAFLADAFSDPGLGLEPPLKVLEQSAVNRAQAIATEGHELARNDGLTVEVRVERDETSAWRTILDVADEIEAELIVVGTRGRIAVQSDLLGSVSGAIVHHSR